jgi:ABC-type transport system involved in multi-copper enzyme maturation permease subunit
MTKPPSALAAVLSIARVTFRRSTRGMLPAIAFIISLLPVAAAAPIHKQGGSAAELVMLVLVILPPMFVASSLGEEIEDKTAAYLWSRPLARWTIVAGKLLALAPTCAAFVAGSAIASGYAGDPALLKAGVITAVAAGAIATCCAVAGIAAILPRHAMIFAIIYLLLDLTIGSVDASMHYASLAYAMRTIAGQTSSAAITGAIGMLAIAGFWLTLAFRRIARLEI